MFGIGATRRGLVEAKNHDKTPQQNKHSQADSQGKTSQMTWIEGTTGGLGGWMEG